MQPRACQDRQIKKNFPPVQCFHRLEDSFKLKNHCFGYDFKANANILLSYSFICHSLLINTYLIAVDWLNGWNLKEKLPINFLVQILPQSSNKPRVNFEVGGSLEEKNPFEKIWEEQ